MGSVVAMVGARHVDSESVRLLWRFSYFGARGRASVDSTDVAQRFCRGVSCFLLGLGFGLIFLFGLLVLFFGVPRFLPVFGTSLTPAWVVLLLSAVLRLFGVEGLVGVGCNL
ncbi:hypothetical protein RHMOL_Rhmol09G0165100 [Rhododendron molle]|uniref:Uncharacterized protein n=1 Tax=Rhododendron molle TaxID=49168 RepID=A0ACC0ME24_RHOML|nr:hypothetical protein RHMOL_Rhmol09G0165100 [Rhododendron molle]